MAPMQEQAARGRTPIKARPDPQVLILLIPIAWLLTREGSCRACAWGAAACYLVLSRVVIDPLVSMQMFGLLQALALLSWLALLPGVLGYARAAR